MDVDDPSTAGREVGTAQQTSPLAHTSSLKFVFRELTEQVVIVTVSCQRGLFQQRFSGTEARVFHDTSPQRIIKCDAGMHEETCAHVVLSCDTTMFQGIVERMPNELAALPTRAKVLGTGRRSKPLSSSMTRPSAGTPPGHFQDILSR